MPATRSPKKRARKTPRTYKPENLSLEDWQIALRREFGREQRFKLRNVGQNEARPTELLLQVLDVGTVPDQRLYRRRLARGAAHREKCPWH